MLSAAVGVLACLGMMVLVMGHQLEGKEEAGAALCSVCVRVQRWGKNERSYRQGATRGAYDLARAWSFLLWLPASDDPKQGEARVLPGQAQATPRRPSQQYYHHS